MRLTTLQVKDLALEPLLPVTVLFPKLYFLNTASVSIMNIKVKTAFKVGPSDDPLLSANFIITTTNVNLNPGSRLVVPLDTSAMDGNLDLHTIQVTNNGLVTEILHFWIEGLYEESLRVSPPYPSIVV
jgi:hypothetical protein